MLEERSKFRLFEKKIKVREAYESMIVKSNVRIDYHKLRLAVKELRSDKPDLRPNEDEFWSDT